MDSNFQLYLLGVNGEWIKEKQNNVHYIGKLDEETAHKFVSQCDVGLIPYDSGKLYYNLAFPTKLSFYITAGISFLSTPVAEVETIHKKEKIGFIADIEDWNKWFEKADMTEILKDKHKISKISNGFLWTKKMNENGFFKEIISE